MTRYINQLPVADPLTGTELTIVEQGGVTKQVNSAAYVASTGDQTVAGVKTFTASPVVPAPVSDLQAATKKYVDDNAGGGGLWETLSDVSLATDANTTFTEPSAGAWSNIVQFRISGWVQARILSSSLPLFCRLNGDVGANYMWQAVTDRYVVGSQSRTGVGDDAGTYWNAGNVTGKNTNEDRPTFFRVTVSNDSGLWKSFDGFSVWSRSDRNDEVAQTVTSGMWKSTAAITEIVIGTLSGTFQAGGRVILEGLR